MRSTKPQTKRLTICRFPRTGYYPLNTSAGSSRITFKTDNIDATMHTPTVSTPIIKYMSKSNDR